MLGDYAIRKAYEGRIMLIGPTRTGRMLAVNLEPQESQTSTSQCRPVQQVARDASEPITVRLDLGAIKQVRKRAKERGMPPTILIYLWILELFSKESQAFSQERKQGECLFLRPDLTLLPPVAPAGARRGPG